MADIVVKYNGQTITPTPVVSQNWQMIDYGSRWGQLLQIELRGLLTNSTDINTINNIFLPQAKTLMAGDVYIWPGCFVDEVSFADNPRFPGSAIPYTVKLHQYEVISGVIDPVSEYTFSMGDDEIVTLNHKISAKGVRLKGADASRPFSNAQSFVAALEGKCPFTSIFCGDTLNTNPVRTKRSEEWNYGDMSYTVNETYKYNYTGTQNFVETFSCSTSDITDNDYLTVDAELKALASTVDNSYESTIGGNLASMGLLSRLSSLGINTGNMVRVSSTVTKNSGDASLTIRGSFLSGTSTADVTGYLDYVVSMNRDLVVGKEDWSLHGEYVCRGPLAYRRSQLTNWKNTYSSNWRGYLTSLILGSPIYSFGHVPTVGIPNTSIINIQENTGLALFRCSLTLMEGQFGTGIKNPKYSVNVTPAKWNFDLLPSANIEGHYVLQDSQMLSRPKVSVQLSCETTATTGAISGLSLWMRGLENIYVGASGMVTSEQTTTGLFDANYNKEWIVLSNTGVGLESTKVFYSVSNNYLRGPGYKFGY